MTLNKAQFEQFVENYVSLIVEGLDVEQLETIATDLLILKVAVESPEDWKYNIFHNAHYGIFCLREGKLELISKHFEMPKFRKCKCNSFEVAQNKVTEWIAQFN